MIGRLKKTCRANLHGQGYCGCSNAHDSKGRRKERRLVKRREKQNLKNSAGMPEE
jgi:predicted adenine nucleotide alpha hydrolase (AANH) superfamily ATPase